MAKVITKGEKLQLSIATVYTDIPGIKSLTGPGPKVQFQDTTALDSGVGMEKDVTGHTDGGTVSCTIFFDPANSVHKAMLAIASTPAVSSWKRIFADGTSVTWPFTAICTSPPNPQADVNGILMASFELTLDGIPTYP
jgi:hypothetical protein